VKKTVIEHLGQLDFLRGKQNVILLGPPGSGKRTSRPPSGSGRASPGSGCSSRPPPNGSCDSPKPNAKTTSKPNYERRLSFVPLLIIDLGLRLSSR
jgi:hypothetical protein